MDSEAKDLIDRISAISDSVKKDIRPLVQKLAANIARNIKSPEIINMAKLEGVNDPTEKDVARILNRLRQKYNWAFGKTSLYSYIQSDYKNTENPDKEYEQPIKFNDNYIQSHYEEIKEKLREFDRQNTPAKEIIQKANKEQMEKYTWNCWYAEELAMIAIKMENDHNEKHDDELCKEYAKRVKMVRDSRFATDANSYEAIICACNTSQSLKNAIKGEWEFKTLWEILDDMEKCRECIKENCKHEKCNHECHRVVRPMTTKGLKYAIKTNEDLKELDQHIKRLQTMSNDICKIGKILLENPKTKKALGVTEIKKLIYSHVEKDECLQCDLFLEKNPNFFEEFK